MIKNWIKENKIKIIFILILALCLAVGWILYDQFGHQLIKEIYEGRSIGFLNKIIREQPGIGVENYYNLADAMGKGILILAIFLVFIPRKHLKAISVLWLFAIINLYIKITPRPALFIWRDLYARYACSLDAHPEMATRWLSPWIAHYLGFNSFQGWAIFLLVAFLIGLSYLYLGVYKLTQDKKWAFLLVFIPVATTMGWFNVYFSGFNDWFLFMLLTAALFIEKDFYSFIFIILAIFTHERATFVILLLPFMRAVLNKQFEEKKIIRNLAISILIIICFFIFRKYTAVTEMELTSRFYLKAYLRDRPLLAHQRVTIKHILTVILEGYKSFVFLSILCFFSLFKSKFHAKCFGLLVIILAFLFIPCQLLIAADSVRLVDLLIYPILLILLLCYREAPKFRKYLLIFVLLSLIINQLLPVVCIAQNGRYVPKSIINTMWKKR